MGIFCFGYTRLEWIFVTLPNAKSPDWGHFFKIAFGVLMVPVLRYNGKHGEQSMEVLTDNILQEVRLLCVHNSSVLTLWLNPIQVLPSYCTERLLWVSWDVELRSVVILLNGEACHGD